MEISPLAPTSYPTLPSIAGVELAVCAAEVRYAGRDDVLLVRLAEGTQVAGVYTRSLTAAGPVEWCRDIGSKGSARALIVNSGNANAFTGKRGMESVRAVAAQVSASLGCAEDEVFMASTGVIGEQLPHERITAKIDTLRDDLAQDSAIWERAARAIMTTDTYAKYITRTAEIDGTAVVINAIAKGSGMIAPDMATMLSFIFTDANISAKALQAMLTRHNQQSFNSITVDGDTSTSDTALLFATGQAGHGVCEHAGDERLADFSEKLGEVLHEMALQIVCDGEGATKKVEVLVTGAEDDAAAHAIGMSIGNSPLVKTAVAGEDPNWGRIVMAVGKSGQWADRDKLRIQIGDEVAAELGELCDGYVEARAAKHMQGEHVKISVDVGVGEGSATIWTCDLTKRYIEINADYRS